MSDARSLLRAKRQEVRITHPYATYSSSGQLRCTVCSVAVKQASMWEGHLGSKVHRTNVMKEKEKERQREEMLRKQQEEDGMEDDDMEEDDGMQPLKRKMEDVSMDAEDITSKKQRSDNSQLAGSTSTKGGFPADFFSDPSRAPVLDVDEDEGERTPAAPSAPVDPVQAQLDLELQAFEAAVANQANEDREEDRRDMFNRATVFAEADVVSHDMEGIPPDAADGGPEVLVPQRDETEEEKRARLAQEEREEIMDRLLEEERAQEEADSRVELLKHKVEALKRAREERKTAMQKKAK